MNTVPDKVIALIQPIVEGLGYEHVGIEYLALGSNSILRVYIDHPEGIDIDDCQKISHQVSGALDVVEVIGGEYHLEVSSPGLDRLLFTLEHFKQFIGGEVKIKLVSLEKGRKRIKGKIVAVNEDEVTVSNHGENYHLSLENIDSARIIPSL